MPIKCRLDPAVILKLINVLAYVFARSFQGKARTIAPLELKILSQQTEEAKYRTIMLEVGAILNSLVSVKFKLPLFA